MSDAMGDVAVSRGEGLATGLAGGVGVAALPNREANGLDSRDAAAGCVAAPGRGRGGRGGLVGVEAWTACGRGGSGSEG